MSKKFIILFLVILSFSCGKDKKQPDDLSSEDDGDTVSLSPQELFSITMTESILNIEDDDDLNSYLEEEIYPIVKSSDKVTIDRITSSFYLLTTVTNSTEKFYMIRKFYNPQTDEIFFEKSEVQFDIKKLYFNN